MPIEVKIPDVGESITEVQISEWLKSEGDEVKADEAVAIIDSEKTTFELTAPDAGRLTKLLHKPGDTVKVGEVVAQIDSDVKAAAKKPTETKKAADDSAPEPRSEASPTEQPGQDDKQGENESNEIKETGGAEPEQPED